MQEAKVRNPVIRLANVIREVHTAHLTRHRSTGFGFVFADKFDYLDPVRWDEVTSGRSGFLRRDVLRIIENHGPENIEPRYAMIFRGNKAVGALAAQLVSVSGDRLHAPGTVHPKDPKQLLRRTLKPFSQAATSKFRDRMLV